LPNEKNQRETLELLAIDLPEHLVIKVSEI